MEKSSKIYVAGHKGLVGSAIVRNLQSKGYTNIIGRTHSELDLTDARAVDEFFSKERPEYVFLAAAKVGGIMANSLYRADFIMINMQIQCAVISACLKWGVKKLMFLGSSCIYPRDAKQPMTEEALLTSELEYTNEPYAIAKIAGIKMCESMNIQHGTNYIAVMPTNLYGPNDNYDLEKSHVLPAMIRKMHLARAYDEGRMDAIRADFARRPVEGVDGDADEADIIRILNKYGIQKGSLTLWGTGTPLREFLHSDDMADACVYLMENIDFKDILKERNMKEIRNTHINIGSGTELHIADIAAMVKETVGFKGELKWDSTKPDGTPRKLMDVSRLARLGWKYKIHLKEGIEGVYKEYTSK
ncbi:MAG: NAD-dependent epimerase/dehydratase family protein [Bacteroidales bacterium]|jgi:GDP-L-fucose synthase|nr:NAD-dependent epimerase/dehydratase family protein [Bacteroidales bacterium]